MFDPIGAFKKQFTPVDGGYLFYPSARSGGKLITPDEYDGLVAGWERVAGRAGRWKGIGLVIGLIIAWTLLSDTLHLSGEADTFFTAAIVLALSGWFLWAGLAPRRLVKDRVSVTPPRPSPEARREARSVMNWKFVLFALAASGAAFFNSVTAPERTPSTWAWLVGSGLMFVVYVWIGANKLLDGRR